MSYGYLAAPRDETYAEAFVREVYNDINDIKHSFIKIGFRLSEANKYRYYEELGFSSIEELAEVKFGFKRTETYNLMQIHVFARDEKQPMQIAERFDKYSKSQLLEMSRSKHPNANYRLAQIIPETATVKEIQKVIRAWNKYDYVGSISDDEFKQLLEDEAPLISLDNQSTRLDSEYDRQESAAGKPESVHTSGLKEELTENSVHMYGHCQDDPEQNSVQISGKSEPTPNNDELIAECMRRDAYKNAIYKKCLEQPSKEEFINFLKDMHGNHGGTWACGDCWYRDYSRSKGIILGRRDCPNLVISWSVAASTIKKLIEAKSYLTEDELGLNTDKPAPLTPDWTEEEPTAEPAEEFFQTSEIAPAPKAAQTNKDYLATLTSAELAEKLCMKIIQIFPMQGKSSQFYSNVRVKLAQWLSEPREVTE